MILKSSIEKLLTCHNDIITVINEVGKYFDICIVCGERNEEEQNKAFSEGKSKLKFPESKHNTHPSKAVDVVSLINNSISWDSKQAIFLAGYIMAVANQKGIKLRWGGDWNSDNNLLDNKFNDLVHFELSV